MDFKTPQIGLVNKADILNLFKALGINTRNLKGYDELYGTTPFTFGYNESSMWSYTYHPRTGKVEYHSTYIKPTEVHLAYNKVCSIADIKKQWEEVKPKLDSLNKYERAAWLDLQKEYDLN